MVSASMAPWVNIGQSEKAWLDAFHISLTAVNTTLGKPWPPNSGSQPRPFQPLSTN